MPNWNLTGSTVKQLDWMNPCGIGSLIQEFEKFWSFSCVMKVVFVEKLESTTDTERKIVRIFDFSTLWQRLTNGEKSLFRFYGKDGHFHLLSLSCAFISDRNSQASFIFLVYLYFRNFENFRYFSQNFVALLCALFSLSLHFNVLHSYLSATFLIFSWQKKIKKFFKKFTFFTF